MDQRIAIYAGEAAMPIPLPKRLSGRLLTPLDVIETAWNETCALFIMPGGRDRPYHAALQGLGNQRIRAFVENGGAYLGICAGAYYGSKWIEFDKDYPGHICEERELAFFLGTAIGPAYGKGTYDITKRTGARAAKLATRRGTFHAYYNGGCMFEGDFSGVRVLARYGDLPGAPPAIIECPIGKGKAILSGVHLEIAVDSLDRSDPYLAPLIPLLAKSEKKRKLFWEGLLESLVERK